MNGFRKLAKKQATQIAKSLLEHEATQALRAFLDDFYGTDLYIVKVEIARGTDTDYVQNVVVFTAELKTVLPDLTFPAWQRLLCEERDVFDPDGSKKDMIDAIGDYLVQQNIYLEYGIEPKAVENLRVEARPLAPVPDLYVLEVVNPGKQNTDPDPALTQESGDVGGKTENSGLSYPITNIAPEDLEDRGFTNAERTYLVECLPEIAEKMADVYLDTRYWEDLDYFARDILERKRQNTIYSYLEELLAYTPEAAQTILAASEHSPWLDQGTNEAPGHGYVLPLSYVEAREEGIVIPAAIPETRRLGLFLDGPISITTIQRFRDILGGLRIWRAWPDSNFALIVPEAVYTSPMDDPLLKQLAQEIPLEEAFRTLEHHKLVFIDLREGHLLAQNEQGQIELWWMLPDGRGIDEDLSAVRPIVEYDGDLYSYEDTYPTKEEAYLAILHEIGKGGVAPVPDISFPPQIDAKGQ